MNNITAKHKGIPTPIRNDCPSLANRDWFEFGTKLNNIRHFATARNSWLRIRYLWCRMGETKLRFSCQTKIPCGWTFDNIRNSCRKKEADIEENTGKQVFLRTGNKDFLPSTQRIPNKRRYVRQLHASGVSWTFLFTVVKIRRRPAGVRSKLK